MGTYRGRRHAMSLPVRGQRTRTQVGPHYTQPASSALTPFSDRNCQKVEQSCSQRLSASVFFLLYKYSHNGIGWRKWFAIPKILILLYPDDSHSTLLFHAEDIPKLLPTNDRYRVKLRVRGYAPTHVPVLVLHRHACKQKQPSQSQKRKTSFELIQSTRSCTPYMQMLIRISQCWLPALLYEWCSLEICQSWKGMH